MLDDSCLQWLKDTKMKTIHNEVKPQILIYQLSFDVLKLLILSH